MGDVFSEGLIFLI